MVCQMFTWFFLLISLRYALKADAQEDDDRCYLNLTVYRHSTCRNFGPQGPKLTLPSSSQTFITQDHDCGCFNLRGGTVTVERSWSNRDIQVHLDMRIGGHSIPEECHNPGPDNCGGFGSCIYCDVCQSVRNVSENEHFQIVRLRKRGRDVHCGQRLQAGFHNDLSLSVCLPPKKKLLSMLSNDPRDAQDIWDTFLRRKDRRGKTGIPFVIFARIFEKPINRLSKKELSRHLYGRNREGMIGCHWMYGLIGDNQHDQNDRRSQQSRPPSTRSRTRSGLPGTARVQTTSFRRVSSGSSGQQGRGSRGHSWS